MQVELLDVLGDDTLIVNTARVSYSKEASSYTEEQNHKLLNYLAKHNHWSPYSHAVLRYRITCPIYVERQLLKSMAGVTVNSISGRYVDFSDTYYEIQQFRKQSVSSKQGSAEDLDAAENREALYQQTKAIETCKAAYEKLLQLGVAKELARTVLPLSLQTTMIWTGSLYTLIRLCNQRLKPDAQQETRELVQLMLDAVKATDKFTHSLAAYGY